ncbi:MAG: UbiX family flavin prenyltransferase [Candidatus Verstraetearchaeota archaeon]|nr:UbiX family flavin prenyltransferase [Candidatus Verstraetearchaeota archaeon]
MRVVVGITGATGTVYGCRLLEELNERNIETTIIVSKVALEILRMENGLGRKDLERFGEVYDSTDMMAPTASGSCKFDSLVVSPCSMKTLAEIANGVSSSLIARTADVALKERRKVILVTRETPLSMIHLKNMLRVTSAGGIVMPASPGFYHNPKTIGELVDYIIGKVLDQLGIENDLFKRWGEPPEG